jgi:hypothetical protein
MALESGQGVLNEVGVAVVKGQPDKAVNASTAPRRGQLGEPVEHQRTSQFARRGLTLRNRAVRILNVDDRAVSTCEPELAVDTAE